MKQLNMGDWIKLNSSDLDSFRTWGANKGYDFRHGKFPTIEQMEEYLKEKGAFKRGIDNQNYWVVEFNGQKTRAIELCDALLDMVKKQNNVLLVSDKVCVVLDYYRKLHV